MSRFAATCFVLIAIAIALWGCGSASPTTQAQAINLRPSDVPGSTAGIVFRHPITYGPLTAPTERCDGGLPGPGKVVGYSSRRLYVPPSEARPSGTTSVGPVHLHPLITARSVVYFFGSEAAALRELAVVASARARTCIRDQALRQRVVGEASGRAGTAEHKSRNGPLYTHLQIAALPVSFPRTWGLSFAGGNTFFPGPSRHEYHEVRGFVVGRKLVVLYTWSEPHPFPGWLEFRLFGLLRSRATGSKRVLIIK